MISICNISKNGVVFRQRALALLSLIKTTIPSSVGESPKVLRGESRFL